MPQDITRMTPEQVAERLQRGDEIVLLDVRRGSYDRSDTQAEGSVRIDPNAIEDEFERIPAGSEVVAYCTCPKENTSARAALFLSEHGYRAAALAGGYKAWEEGGFATEPQ